MGPIKTARTFIISRIFVDVLGAFYALKLGAFLKNIKNNQKTINNDETKNFRACGRTATLNQCTAESNSLCDFIFCMLAKHIIREVSRFFAGASTFLTPRKTLCVLSA
jgi:hypothetical protein